MKATTRILALAAIVSLAATLAWFGSSTAYAQQTDRAKRLGGRLMCMCGCSQVLTACNHVGCSVSTAMLKKMDVLVTRNDPDDLTLQAFVQEWGEKVLAEPPAKGFNRVAWFIPGVAFGIGLVIVLLVIQHWRKRMTLAPATPVGPPVSAELLARARRQADRETEEQNACREYLGVCDRRARWLRRRDFAGLSGAGRGRARLHLPDRT